jgi:hypothetical protein
MVLTAIWWAMLVWAADERYPARVFWTIILVPIFAGLVLASVGLIARNLKQEK